MDRKNKHFIIVASLVLTSCTSWRPAYTKKSRKFAPLPKKTKYISGMKKKVALLTFVNEAPQGGEDLGIVAAEELRRELHYTGEFVVDPMAEKIFGDSKKVYAGGGTNLMQLSRKAKVSGINFVVFGRVIQAQVKEKSDEIGLMRETRSSAQAQVEVRIFDVNSNKDVHSQVIQGYANDKSFRFFGQGREKQLTYRRQLLRYAVRIAVKRSIPKILETSRRFNWVGRVAKIIGNKIYINAGRNSGMQVGDILKVITEGQEIFDPETGALVGVSKGQLKGTIEVVEYFGPDGSVAVVHSGGSVQEGDFVQLY